MYRLEEPRKAVLAAAETEHEELDEESENRRLSSPLSVSGSSEDERAAEDPDVEKYR